MTGHGEVYKRFKDKEWGTDRPAIVRADKPHYIGRHNYRPMENCGKCNHCVSYSGFQNANCNKHGIKVQITMVCDDYE